MTDLEINKALALAIGWTEDRLDKDGQTDPDVVVFSFNDPSRNAVKCWDGDDWRVFDYRDWNVIGPIAAKYDLFPMVAACHADQWAIVTDTLEVFEDTPQKAIAMAVIAGAK